MHGLPPYTQQDGHTWWEDTGSIFPLHLGNFAFIFLLFCVNVALGPPLLFHLCLAHSRGWFNIILFCPVYLPAGLDFQNAEEPIGRGHINLQGHSSSVLSGRNIFLLQSKVISCPITQSFSDIQQSSQSFFISMDKGLNSARPSFNHLAKQSAFSFSRETKDIKKKKKSWECNYHFTWLILKSSYLQLIPSWVFDNYVWSVGKYCVK